MANWSAAQYLRFEAERTRPAADLLARVPGGPIDRIADLGCGPGNSTGLLRDRFPQAAIVGVDSSDDMLAKARSRLPRVTFEKADIDQPSHVLMRKVAARAPFSAKLAGANAAREEIGAFVDYYAALAPVCADIDVWRTTYVHALAGPDAIVDWVAGTGLRPFLAPLAPDERQAFLAQYREEIAAAYPPLADGRVLLPFPRLFVVAVRRGTGRARG
jgi:trans-aconitate 2-methyltransferase